SIAALWAGHVLLASNLNLPSLRFFIIHPYFVTHSRPAIITPCRKSVPLLLVSSLQVLEGCIQLSVYSLAFNHIYILVALPLPSVVFRLTPLLPNILQQPVRPLTYCSLRKGKRKTVKAVVKRFLRLHSGLWVRRKSGYKKKLWKKSTAQKKRLREFVLCNRTQCKLLDKMTTSFWKRRNWYVDDPYQKYHNRTNLSV
uniref:Large ribosomal subunit protein bL35m n=1 Tax=Meleagris gallopavo TaxID=9103 RepID=A0A803YPD6_MELGA